MPLSVRLEANPEARRRASTKRRPPRGGRGAGGHVRIPTRRQPGAGRSSRPGQGPAVTAGADREPRPGPKLNPRAKPRNRKALGAVRRPVDLGPELAAGGTRPEGADGPGRRRRGSGSGKGRTAAGSREPAALPPGSSDRPLGELAARVRRPARARCAMPRKRRRRPGAVVASGRAHGSLYGGSRAGARRQGPARLRWPYGHAGATWNGRGRTRVLCKVLA